jgi:hypothetical protein
MSDLAGGRIETCNESDIVRSLGAFARSISCAANHRW